ncbi:hypothetical protein [Salinispora oceanensis]|uniref:hypothetical protein n=1 Tax=Salinispora oceanensis TaxID=1050199 RepID=UPI0003816B34|nr:hypothetical protein [Salinispora oceanensis]
MGDDWLAGENIDVDIQQLDDFAAAIMDELNANFTPSYQHGVAPMLQVRAPFGTGGMNEGKYFQGTHTASVNAMMKLLDEVTKGLMSLSVAAKTISAGYLTEDALAEATNDDVLGAFAGIGGQNTLSAAWQQDNEGQGDSANTISSEHRARFEEDFAVSVGGGGVEGLSTLHQPETIGEGSATYQIQGDDEGMHGDEVAPADIDLQS